MDQQQIDFYFRFFVYLDQYKKIFWFLGWLFTLGYGDFFNSFHELFLFLDSPLYFLALLFCLAVTFLIWPYALGLELRSRGF